MKSDPPPRYRETLPSPALRPWVERYWSVRGTYADGAQNVRMVLPDGCMDVIFDLSTDADDRALGGSFAVGTMTRPLPVRSEGTVHLVGVRFRPGGGPAFLDVAAHELVDRRSGLDAFWGVAAAEAHARIVEQGAPAIDALLLERLGRVVHRRDDEAVRRAAELLGRPDRADRIDDLAGALHLGRRQLERRFQDAVGVPPATLARILRFRRAVDLLGGGSPITLSRVAAEAGYHDQSHMNRDFRDFAGVTPGAYRTRLGANVASVQDPAEAAD